MLTHEQRIGLFVVCATALLVVAIELTAGIGLFGRRVTLHARFDDVQGLDRGAEVRLAGIRAGRVTDVRLDGDRVDVTMAVDADLVPHRDATARLDFRALSGERFVASVAGLAVRAARRAPATCSRAAHPRVSETAVDRLAAVAASVNDLTTRLDTDAGRVLGTLGDLVEDNRQELTALTQHLASITAKLDAGIGTLRTSRQRSGALRSRERDRRRGAGVGRRSRHDHATARRGPGHAREAREP